MFRNKTLIGLNLAVFLMMLGVGMIVAILPQKVIVLTGSGELVGILASAFALSYILFQLPIGNLSDKFGFKQFLIFGYILCTMTGLLFYFTKNVNIIFLGRLMQGIGEAPIWALAPALLSIKYPLIKGQIMGLYNASIHIGLTIGPILGIVFATLLSGNEVFLFYAIVCFLGSLVIYFMVDDVNSDERGTIEPISFNKIVKIAANREILVTLLGITVYGAGYGIFLTVIPAFLITLKNFNEIHIGIFFSLFYAAISISQIITGPLSDRMGRKIFMLGGLVLALCGIIIFPILVLPWISIVLFVASLGLGVFYLSSMAFLNEAVPNSLKGTISGAYYLFWGIGMFFAPLIVGRASTVYSYKTGFYLFTAAVLLEVLGMLIYFSKVRK
ncbi:MAG: MFS transporter [Desulfitibacter sp. BRH_c19]|nr:MAG: MFS transporter [Desulfitibacter sp. BRH_c19]